MNDSQPPDYNEDEYDDGILPTEENIKPLYTESAHKVASDLSAFFAQAWIH